MSPSSLTQERPKIPKQTGSHDGLNHDIPGRADAPTRAKEIKRTASLQEETKARYQQRKAQPNSSEGTAVSNGEGKVQASRRKARNPPRREGTTVLYGCKKVRVAHKESMTAAFGSGKVNFML